MTEFNHEMQGYWTKRLMECLNNPMPDTREVNDALDYINRGALLNTALADGRTALHLVAKYACWDRVMGHVLCECPELVNKQDHSGDTPLMKATYSLNRTAVNRLLAAKADPQIKNNAGLTPLEYLALQIKMPALDAVAAVLEETIRQQQASQVTAQKMMLKSPLPKTKKISFK